MRPLAIAALAVLAAGPPARAAVNVVAATEDLADLTRQVGGDKVKVEAIAKGYQDPHFVEAKPSFILKLAHADLLVVVGRDLEDLGGERGVEVAVGPHLDLRVAALLDEGG